MPSKSGETSMAMGTRRRRQQQERLWISHNELAKGPRHRFYQRVNELLEEGKFDAFAEKECAKCYAANHGRPSLVPGIYFRLLLGGILKESIRSAGSLGERRIGSGCGRFWESGNLRATGRCVRGARRTVQEPCTSAQWRSLRRQVRRVRRPPEVSLGVFLWVPF